MKYDENLACARTRFEFNLAIIQRFSPGLVLLSVFAHSSDANLSVPNVPHIKRSVMCKTHHKYSNINLFGVKKNIPPVKNYM